MRSTSCAKVTVSGPAMSSDSGPSTTSLVPARSRKVITSRPSIGRVRWLRHAGSGMTGTRSTRRTRKRKERERAETTIEARSATASGAASSSACSTSRRLARCGEAGASAGTRPPR